MSKVALKPDRVGRRVSGARVADERCVSREGEPSPRDFPRPRPRPRPLDDLPSGRISATLSRLVSVLGGGGCWRDTSWRG
ncbi:hypothetical protein chiPu_0025720, partial [Chiloscyllium punctatum]|nr:hypothetical protein [Chiloscyllium punctatum]